MNLRTVLYTSSSQLGDRDFHESVEAIVQTSVKNNARADITGALMFSGKSFVQVLEGPATALSRLLTVLKSDDRHRSLTVLDDMDLKERRFADWTMAYVGPSVLVERHTRRLSAGVSPREIARVKDWLARLLLESQQAKLLADSAYIKPRSS